MADYRAGLYQNYVSTFQIVNTYGDPAAQAARFAYYGNKYLPRLKGLKPDAAVLELGCGPGQFLAFLQGRGFKNVSGIDISPEQIAIAQEQGLDARLDDVFECLDGAQGTYDAIVALDFLEHFTKEELMRLTQSTFGALKEGGLFLAQTPNGQGLFPQQIIYGDLTHSTILNESSLLQLLRQTGFSDVSFHETGPAPINPAGRVRAVAWCGIKAGLNLLRRIETGKTQQVWTENIICLCRKPKSS